MTDAERIKEALAYINNFSSCAITVPAKNCLRSILSPPPKEHIFGGARFVETGEERVMLAGEWALGSKTPGALQGAIIFNHILGHYEATYPILRYAPEGSE